MFSFVLMMVALWVSPLAAQSVGSSALGGGLAAFEFRDGLKDHFGV